MPSRPHRPSAPSPLRAGLSLLEVLIAMSILLVGLTVLFSALLNARKVNEQTINMALAYQEIQAQIETYQYLPFADLQRTFKGASFTVKGLSPALTPGTGVRRATVGTVTRLDNPNPYDALFWGSTTNPNVFDNSNTRLPLRFRCEWDQDNSRQVVELVYVFTYRGI